MGNSLPPPPGGGHSRERGGVCGPQRWEKMCGKYAGKCGEMGKLCGHFWKEKKTERICDLKRKKVE